MNRPAHFKLAISLVVMGILMALVTSAALPYPPALSQNGPSAGQRNGLAISRPKGSSSLSRQAYEPAPTVHVDAVFTTDDFGLPSASPAAPQFATGIQAQALQDTFTFRDAIQEHLTITNDLSTDQDVTATWQVTDSLGREIGILCGTWTITTNPGTYDWYIRRNIPTYIYRGTYTFTGSVTYNGNTTTQSIPFTVTGPATVEVLTTTVTGTIPFAAGGAISLNIDTFNDVADGESATYIYELVDPWGRMIYNLYSSGSKTTPLGRSLMSLSGNLPSDAISGEYSFTARIRHGNRETYAFSTFHVNGVGGPPNDLFTSPTVINSVPYTTYEDTWPATISSDDPTPSCGQGQNANSVWFRYTPAQNGLIIVDSSGSSYDTVATIWTGTQGNLTEVACNDDSGGTSQSLIMAPISGGLPHYVEIMNYQLEGGGYLKLHVDFASAYTPTLTPTPTFTQTLVPTSGTSTSTYTPTNTSLPATSTFTPTFTRTNTLTPTYTRTNTPVPPTNTFTPTYTRTNTPIPPTNTFPPTNTATNTPVPPTNTFTPTNTATNTPVPPTNTFSPTSTYTNTSVPPTNTFTPTSTSTNTPVPPTSTFTPTYTPTNTSSPATNTFTPTYTRTNTPVPPTNTPIPPTNTFTPTSPPSVTIPLVSGWNLISFNLHPADTTISTILASASSHVMLVYAWNASSAAWKKYDPSSPPYANSLANLDESMGSWIEMSSADTLVVSGSAIGISNIALQTGWNLVGYPSTTNLPLPDVFSLHGVGSDFSLVYAYHAGETRQWEKFDPSAPPYANTLTELTPDYGYWIKINAAHTWDVSY
jgi:hypothetical protein